MTRPTRFVMAAVLAAGAVGCSSAAQSPAQPGPLPAAVQWADGVCGTVRPFVEAASAGPQVQGSDAAAAVKAISVFLGRTADSLDGVLARLATTPPAPVSNGAVTLRTLTDDYTGYRTSLRDAKGKVDAIDVTDTQKLSAELPAAMSALPAAVDPTKELRANPELQPAVDAAANCRALPNIG